MCSNTFYFCSYTYKFNLQRYAILAANEESMRSYTIKDIAKLADVSAGTVDRVIHKRGKVSDKALQKVNAVLAQIDYEPNIIAKSLKNQKVWVIAVLIPDIETDEYWMQVYDGVREFEKEYKGFGFKVAVDSFSSLDAASFIKASAAVLKLQPDALLLAPLFLHESITFANELAETGTPVITINNEIEEVHPLTFIGQNLIESGRTAGSLIHRCSRNLQDIFVIHISEDPVNASHMTTKSQGIKDYFKDKDVLIHDLKINAYHQNYLDQVKSISNVPDTTSFFITTSKAHQVAVEIKEWSPGAVIVGYDLIPENVALLKTGDIDFLINQNPSKMSFEGLMRFTDKFLFSKELAPHYYLPIDIINAENVRSYLSS